MKKRVLQEYPPGKRKMKLSSFCSKDKDTFFFRSYNISREKKRSLKKYRTNVFRVFAGVPGRFHSLKLSPVVIV